MDEAPSIGRLIQLAYWRTRRALRTRPRSDEEAQRALSASTRTSSGLRRGLFPLPWGDVEFTSSWALAAQFNDIFINRQYAFASSSPSPVIVDCGGNIGLSAIWFKRTYPGSRLTVYEADPRLCEILRRNLNGAGISDVTLHNRAVWTENALLGFEGTGDDRGRISAGGALSVEGIALADALPDCVDLLKLDIEGAEYEVLDHLCRTGAISRVVRLVCEFHVGRNQAVRLLSTLRLLADSGMELSMTACLADWTGAAVVPAPFEAVDRRNVFMMVYAWRGDRNGRSG